ncbi:Calx-beta domain-containing protein [Okeanomitos corallinicola TIOX110]|uniref:Calx-beta domain-containing protein n=1 Tax=Okeanomitos corallinicola TIOX110 TaxID=3133117 RepID=A0ABZ2V274_9CYAN
MSNLDSFGYVLDTAFGTAYNRNLAEILRLQWQAGDFSQIPQIEILDSSILGTAQGAYAISTNTIYLSDYLVKTGTPEAISRVLLEEIGHFVDAQINTLDASGDEGAIFAELVQGNSLDAATLEVLKNEDDTAVIDVDGESVLVEQANLSGTSGNDTITGTTGNDVISGLGGNDRLYGLEGNDSLNGGGGNDIIFSDAGNDTINGATGFDYYVADYSDRTTGLTMTYDPTTGNGTITIGSEVDTLISIESFNEGFGLNGGFKGTAFADVIVGTSDSENYYWYGIYGGDGNDTISGGAGDDNVYGEEGNDVLNGDAGNDYLYGGNGNDSLNGGVGDDVIYSDIGNDTINGGTGFDYYVADYSDRTTGLTMTYDPTTGNGTITIGSEVDTLISIESFNEGFGLNGGFKGTAFADVIVGTSDSENYYWYGIYGGDGNDTISGGAGDDNVYGEEGNDVLNGDAGNDYLYGGNGNDSLNGGVGDDVIYSDIGNDTINGGTGFDYYVADYSDRTTGLTMTYDPTTGNGTITIGSEVDTLISIESFNEGFGLNGGFKGTAFADVIVGTSDSENYYWYGIYGGDGNDTISGGAGDDNVYGEEGNDVLNGDAGNDYLYGGNGNDSLNGGVGDDVIYSDIGNDTINGGTGFDYYVADYSDRTTGLTMTYDPTTGNGTITIGSEVDTLISIESFNEGFGLNGGFKGTAFADVIVGTSDSENYYWYGIYGGDGNDTISGGAGDDNVYGEEGNDTLTGVDPTSINPGRGERDYLEGGIGADRFILGDATWIGYDDGNSTTNGNSDYAEIEDFNPTEGDVIQLQGTSSNYLLTVVGADTQIFINKPGTEPDELIGIIRNQTGLSLTGDYFAYNQDVVASSVNINLSKKQTVVEGKTNSQNVVYTVTLDDTSNQTITVQYATSDLKAKAGSDYTSTSGTLTFNPGETSKTISIPILNNSVNEANETFNLTLSNPTNGNLGTASSVLTTITDTLSSSSTITLPVGVENLTLSGKNAINGTGNANANIIKGNSNNNTLSGLAGNDSYLFAANTVLGTDTINETTTGGTDLINFTGTKTGVNINLGTTALQTVNSNLSLVLSANNVIENVTGGLANDVLTGNSLDNTILGGNGDDQLIGQAGNDLLWGGAGNDTLNGGTGGDKYQFKGNSRSLSSSLGVDSITQFVVGQDQILLSKSTFKSMTNSAGQVLTDFAVVANNSLVNASSARIVYSQGTGSLFYNQDGSVLGTDTVFEFAEIGNSAITLSGSDFLVIA